MADPEETQLLGLDANYTSFVEDDETVHYRETLLEDSETAPVVTRRRGRGRRKRAFLPTVPDTLVKETTPHYVKDDASEDLLARARLRILHGVESLPVRILGVTILVIDVILVIIELAIGEDKFPVLAEEFIEVVALLFSAYFCMEVSLRIIGQGTLFFHRWFEVLDLIVIAVSTIITVIYVIIDDHETEDEDTGEIVITTSRLFIFGRVIRVFFWARIIYEQKTIQRFIRNKVSQNKRRYRKEGFDLDLTYVTDRVIAMSYPSSGSESFFRNSIRDVGLFLDRKHFGHYRVYNLCSEREYDPSHFHHQVQKVSIDDHNVPKFTDLVDFCEDVYTWMEGQKENVIVVHCKGGKGRTGMMISAWLVRSGLFKRADRSLAYFSDRRTDKNKGEKNQGVDTPSQSRYVAYYERLLTHMEGNLPPPVTLRIREISIYGLTKIGKGDGTDWRFEVFLMRTKLFDCSLDLPSDQCLQVTNDSAGDAVHIVFSSAKPILVSDDVKFKFYCSTKTVTTGVDKCQFYFWFHTTFIEDNRLYLEREALDNLQKSKNRRSYPVNFAVELLFEPCALESDIVAPRDDGHSELVD